MVPKVCYREVEPQNTEYLAFVFVVAGLMGSPQANIEVLYIL